jgi:hypothetical protein
LRLPGLLSGLLAGSVAGADLGVFIFSSKDVR